jgi:hypothetical protein
MSTPLDEGREAFVVGGRLNYLAAALAIQAAYRYRLAPQPHRVDAVQPRRRLRMALALYFPSTMTAHQYDEAVKRLRKAGAGHPAGRTYHACFGTSDHVSVFDVWTSQAAFDKFGQTLMPILHDLGVTPGQPSVMEVHNVMVPPSAKARTTPKPRARAKKAAKGKKSKARRR